MRDIDRQEKNRSKFVAEAVRRELDRRRRDELRRSLQNPHPESAELAEQRLEEWSRGLPEEDVDALVDSSAGKAVRWVVSATGSKVGARGKPEAAPRNEIEGGLSPLAALTPKAAGVGDGPDDPPLTASAG